MNDLTTLPVKSFAATSPFNWLRGEIDRLFEDVWPPRGMYSFASGLAPVPALELTRDDGAYRLSAELPGMNESDVQVSVDEGVLVLKGEKRDESKRKKDGHMVSERRYGSFERHVSLPKDNVADKISAEFKNGVLTISVPRDGKSSAKARKIPIGATAA